MDNYRKYGDNSHSDMHEYFRSRMHAEKFHLETVQSTELANLATI